jgi:hypothetical protein
MDEILASLGISLVGNWPSRLRANLDEALFTIIGAERLRPWLNARPLTLKFGGKGKLDAGFYFGLTSGTTITFFANENTNPVVNILHEFGHAVDNLWRDFFTGNLKSVQFRINGVYIGGATGRTYQSLSSEIVRRDVLKARRAGGSDAWQQRGGVAHFEDWADIFSNSMLANIKPENEAGQQMLDFVALMEAHVNPPAAAE